MRGARPTWRLFESECCARGSHRSPTARIGARSEQEAGFAGEEKHVFSHIKEYTYYNIDRDPDPAPGTSAAKNTNARGRATQRRATAQGHSAGPQRRATAQGHSAGPQTDRRERCASLLCTDRPLLRRRRFPRGDQRLLDPPAGWKASGHAGQQTQGIAARLPRGGGGPVTLRIIPWSRLG